MKKLFIITIIALTIACKNKTLEKPDLAINSKLNITTNNYKHFIIADTIIYDVIIKNPDTNDYWIKECLKYVKIDTFINYLFDKIYKKELIAYDIFKNTPINIKDLKKIEKETDFKRKNIAKLQFTEKWYYDPKMNILKKEILSISFGYETKDKLGKVRGYKPLFKIKFE